jgi:putative protease
MSKIELLAPAGNFECFRAAINAGADAVYLGGDKFGARAYAGNFTTEEIIEALKIAHIFNRKIYLTVNTLIKENEIGELVPYIEPLYNVGLDGVIVQDLGALEVLRSNFPNLELHASTQMAITGMYGAEYMKKLGVCRVVPARELSLDEIRDIKDKTGLDIECFVHGAMCYAYSGQCLFSSVLGGRSGNRGRCAGPCRLPYTDKKGNTVYPLSLKDMYTLPILQELIRAGVNSFKIEGRMKSPEYVAGVTSVYRKYIDNSCKIDKKDEEMLRHLYIRSDICGGYYKKHNDKSMITLGEPGYSGSSDEVIRAIRDKYIDKNITMPINGYVKIRAGEKAVVSFSGGCSSAGAVGEVVSQAQNRPLDEKEIDKRIRKLGDTCFELENLEIDTDNQSFMSIKDINELRRQAAGALEQALCEDAMPKSPKGSRTVTYRYENPKEDNMINNNQIIDNQLTVYVSTLEQLKVVNKSDMVNMIYVNADIFLYGGCEACEGGFDDILGVGLDKYKDYALVLPHILRKRSYIYLKKYENLLNSGRFKGVMVRNFEELEWLGEIGYKGEVYSDYTVYVWNNTALSLYERLFDRITMPIELNKKELGLIRNNGKLSLLVYGYIPLMYSANCVQNTLEGCKRDLSGKMNIYRLCDRYKNVFPIQQNCLHCYNILYNTVPLSLHGQLDGILKRGYGELRLDFSMENERQTAEVISFYEGLIGDRNDKGEIPFKDFTNGHYKRGVE